MTDEPEKPLLSESELRILESIVRREAQSMGEKYEAIRELQAQIEAASDKPDSDHRTLAERLLRWLRECEESMERLKAALRAISDDALTRLTPSQRAQVAHLIVDEGEAVFQAIAKVTKATDANS